MVLKKFFHKNSVKASIFFLAVFVISFAILYLINFVPNELQDQNITTEPSGVASTTIVNKKQYELPIRIVINKIKVNSIIQNPTTTNNYTLNDLLLRGVVRYPGSGLPGEGNMFFFGHSSRLSVVNNQAYRVFSELKTLVAGDTILVYSEKHVYTYRVNNIKIANSEDVLVDFSVKKNMLTLSTCNVFGQKQERVVVEADFVGSASL